MHLKKWLSLIKPISYGRIVHRFDKRLKKAACLLAFVLLTPQFALAAPTCRDLFAENLISLHAEVLTPQTLTGAQVERLNQAYDRWLVEMTEDVSYVHMQMEREKMSAAEQTQTLERMQSVYRSYFESVHPLYLDTRVRRLLNHRDEVRTIGSLSMVQNLVFSRELNGFYKDLLMRQNNLRVSKTGEPSTGLDNSALATEIKHLRLKRGFVHIRDLGRQKFETIVHAVAETIGLTSDTFPLRHGRLYANPEFIHDVMRTLRPMDLLIDRANEFKLSHMIIPGHYGHVGIYLGTKEQLKEIGMWEDPSIVPYHSAIESGHVMLEAKRTGVKLRTLLEYSNTDTVTGLRQRGATVESLQQKMRYGVAQIGKTFDHNFELEHSESFFCSKLVYFVFHDIEWGSRKVYGRRALPPDFIAAQATGTNPALEPVLAFDRGERVTGHLQSYVERSQQVTK